MATTENKEASLLASTYGVVEPGKDKVSTNVSSVTINDLSIEILEHILTFIPTDEIHHVSLTSSRWYSAIKCPKIQSKLKIVYEHRCKFNEWLEIIGPKLEIVKSLEVRSENIIKETDFWLEYGKFIEYLNMTEICVDESDIMSILSNCPNIKSFLGETDKESDSNIILPYLFDKVHTLRLRGRENITEETWTAVKDKQSTIIDLNLVQIPEDHAAYVEYKNHPFDRILRSMTKTLRSLSITSGTNQSLLVVLMDIPDLRLHSLEVMIVESVEQEVFEAFTKRMSHLESFRIRGLHLNNLCLKAMCTNMNHLKKLCTIGCVQFNNKGLSAVKLLKNLEVLEIRECRLLTTDGIVNYMCNEVQPKLKELILRGQFGESIIPAICDSFPNLESLSITSTSWINGIVLREMFSKLTNLRTLKINSLVTTLAPEKGSNSSANLNISEMKNLECIEFQISHDSITQSDEVSLNNIVKLTKLKKLVLSGQYKITHENIVDLCKNSKLLQCVGFKFNPLLTYDHILYMTKNLICLKELTIHEELPVRERNEIKKINPGLFIAISSSAVDTKRERDLR